MQRSQLLQKIKQLEQETAGPERRQAAKARQALMKEVQQGLSESGKGLEDKVAYMESVFAKQVWHAEIPNPAAPAINGSVISGLSRSISLVDTCYCCHR